MVCYIKQDSIYIKEPCYASTTHVFIPTKTMQMQHEFRKNKFVHTGEHIKENNILNIYQLNIFNNFFFYIESKTERRVMFFSLCS